MSQTRTLLKGALILTGAGFLTKMIGFLYRIFLSQTIGAQGMGIYQLIFPLHSLCFALAVGGIQTAISRLVAAKSAKKDEQGARDIFLLASALSLSISIACSFFLYRFADWLALHILFEKACTPLLKLMALSIPMGIFHSCTNGYFFARKKAVIPACAQLLEQIARVASSYVIYQILLNDQKTLTPMIAVAGLFFGELISMLFSALLLLWDYQKHTYSFLHMTHPFKKLGEILSFSLPLTANRVLINVLHSIESVLIPGHLRLFGLDQESALSIYGILNGMALPLIFFPCAVTNALSVMLLPSVAEHQALGNHKKIRRTILLSMKACFFLGFLSTIFFFFAGDWLGLFLFKNEFVGTYIKTLSFICPCLYLSDTLTGILNGLGKTSQCFLENLIGLSVRLLFVFLVIPKYGIIGYLWGLLVSEITVTCMNFYFLREHISQNF